MMYSRESITDAARRQGKTEEEIQRILAGVDKLKKLGLIKTSGGGANVGLTARRDAKRWLICVLGEKSPPAESG